MSEKATSSFMGVCATIANKTGIDVFVVRVAAVAIILLTGGMGLFVYVLLGVFASEA